MKNLLLIILLMMNYHHLSANETSTNDTCKGVVCITRFDIKEIPLYTNAEGQSCDTLKFVLKKNGFYIVELTSGDTLKPYQLQQPAMDNRQAPEESTNNWTRTHKVPKLPIYELSFKLIGDYGDWLCIVLNDKTNETAFIRRDETCMYFKLWEDFIAGALQISFPKLDVYDNKNGEKIELKAEDKRGSIISVEDDWMHVHYYNGLTQGKCWIQWKNKNGMLVTKIIKEFIR